MSFRMWFSLIFLEIFELLYTVWSSESCKQTGVMCLLKVSLMDKRYSRQERKDFGGKMAMLALDLLVNLM
jgi:hypothetical protein